MQVMPAGVHHRYIASAVVFGARLAGIGQTGFLFHGQRVKLRPQHDGGARSVLQDPNHTVPTDVLCNFITQRAQTRGKLGRGPCLMRRQFRVLVQIEVQSLCVRKDSVDLLVERCVLR